MLLIVQHSACADVWAYLDERGVTHFATEPIDSHYILFFRGDSFDSARDIAENAAPTPYALSATGKRLLAFFDRSPDYQSVQNHLRTAATRHGVDYELLQAVIAAESGFNARAVSPKGAMGLMQVMPATASRFGVAADAKRTVEQKLMDPALNVLTGARYLRYLMDLFPGQLNLAIAAYNAGEGAVQRAGNNIPVYKETQDYVRTVMGLYAQLKPPTPMLAQRATTGRVRMELTGGALNRGNLPVAQWVRTQDPPEPDINE